MSVWEGGEDGLSDLWESPHHKDSVYGDIETSDQQTLNLNTQSLPDVQSLPHSVVAHGWIPFMVSFVILRHCHKMSYLSCVTCFRW